MSGWTDDLSSIFCRSTVVSMDLLVVFKLYVRFEGREKYLKSAWGRESSVRTLRDFVDLIVHYHAAASELCTVVALEFAGAWALVGPWTVAVISDPSLTLSFNQTCPCVLTFLTLTLQASTANMLDLPAELWHEILHSSSPRDILSLSHVSAAFHLRLTSLNDP